MNGKFRPIHLVSVQKLLNRWCLGQWFSNIIAKLRWEGSKLLCMLGVRKLKTFVQPWNIYSIIIWTLILILRWIFGSCLRVIWVGWILSLISVDQIMLIFILFIKKLIHCFFINSLRDQQNYPIPEGIMLLISHQYYTTDTLLISFQYWYWF